MDKEITYIPYGQDEISQQDLMTSLANGVPGYLDSKRWAKKDKYRQTWLNAYQDIINGGLVGASNSSGIWTIQHGGEPIDLNTKSNLDREMYQDAAYYIQQQMSRMTPRKKEEEAKKDNLDKYDFTSQFLPQIYNNRYGGNKDLFASEWENLDARGDNGLRGTDNRKAALIDELTKYKQNLLNNKGKYNFEGTAFKDEQDVINRIDEAITAINSPDLSDDNPKLNALGLSYNSFFSNGGNDIYGTDKDGQQVTYQQYYETLNKQKELETKAKEEELKKRKQAAYNNTLFFNRVTNPKMMGQNAIALKEKYKDHNSLFNALQEYAQKDIRTLSPQEQSEVQGAYRYLANQPIDATTLKNLQSSSSGLYKGAAPNRFRKIKGIDNLVWDSVANQVIQITNRQQQEAVKNQPEDLFANIQTKEDIQNIPISKEGWTSADTADVVSMVGDLVSLGGFWANIGGTATSLTSDLYADISRGKDIGDILKGIGVNLGWGLAGMLPGAKSTKLIARAGRLIPKAIMLYQSYNIATDPEVIKSAMKFTSTDGLKTVSSKDLENLKYLFHAVTGGANIAKSHYRAKNYREQLNKTKVQTKEGTKPISNKDIKEINKAGRKEGQKAAESKFKEITGKESVEGQFKFGENGKSKFNPSRYSSILNKFLGKDQQLKGEQTTDMRALSKILQQDKELPWYNWNKGYATFELTPFRNTPPIKQEKSKQTTSKPKTQESSQAVEQKQLENKPTNQREQQYNKATINRYKEHLKGKFSNKKLQSGDYNLNGNNLRVVEQQDGTFNIIYKGDIKGNYQKHQQKELQQKVFDLVKENRKTIDKQSGKSTKKSTAEIGKILQDLKKKGWLKQGGTINTPLDNIIEDFFKNSNI